MCVIFFIMADVYVQSNRLNTISPIVYDLLDRLSFSELVDFLGNIMLCLLR